MRKLLMATAVTLAMSGSAMAMTPEERQECAHKEAGTCSHWKEYREELMASHLVKLRHKAETLPSYVVHFEPIADVEWHLVNQDVHGWTTTYRRGVIRDEAGNYLKTLWTRQFDHRVKVEKGALLFISTKLDSANIETTVRFFVASTFYDREEKITIPTAAIDPTPLVCEKGDSDSHTVMAGRTVIRCRWANSSEWVMSNEDEVRKQVSDSIAYDLANPPWIMF